MTPESTFDRQPSHNAFVGRERELVELRAIVRRFVRAKGTGES